MLAVLMAFWRRPEVTRVVMRHYQRLAEVWDLTLVCVGSEGAASQQLAESCGWHYVGAPNAPLSDKLGAGVRYVQELDPHAGLLAMGADDLVTEEWIDLCFRSDTLLGLRDMYLIRRGSWESVWWKGYQNDRRGEPVGAHRFFPRKILDALDWQLWPAGLNRNLDGNLCARIGRLQPNPQDTMRVLSMQEAGCAALGISGEENLTPWRLILPGAEPIEMERLLNYLPEETRNDVLQLQHT